MREALPNAFLFGLTVTPINRADRTVVKPGADVRPDQVHVVMGDPVRSIPEFVAQQRYELLVLGALTHRKTMTALVGTLTGRLIESVKCDLLLVSCSRP
jgi:nucleotide-binding universal stress UspA family protein